MMTTLQYGQPVWAVLKDRNGFRKHRPGIVLTPTAQIADDRPIVILCVTTSFGEPPPPDHVLLPWNNDPRRVETGLAQRSAAVIGWLDTLYSDEILEIKGRVPPRLMKEIQRRISKLENQAY